MSLWKQQYTIQWPTHEMLKFSKRARQVLFTTGIYEFVHHRSPSEYKQASSKNWGPWYGLPPTPQNIKMWFCQKQI
jgi:hypothetical protein